MKKIPWELYKFLELLVFFIDFLFTQTQQSKDG